MWRGWAGAQAGETLGDGFNAVVLALRDRSTEVNEGCRLQFRRSLLPLNGHGGSLPSSLFLYSIHSSLSGQPFFLPYIPTMPLSLICQNSHQSTNHFTWSFVFIRSHSTSHILLLTTTAVDWRASPHRHKRKLPKSYSKNVALFDMKSVSTSILTNFLSMHCEHSSEATTMKSLDVLSRTARLVVLDRRYYYAELGGICPRRGTRAYVGCSGAKLEYIYSYDFNLFSCY